MATLEECRKALQDVADRIASGDTGDRQPPKLDRSLACRITDLGTGFHGRLAGGTIQNLTDGDDPKAQIALTLSSDDLVALSRGELDFAKAWVSGRIKVQAGIKDMLQVRKLL
ncbi:SCP2 sterol-binding domain-containing protein [Cryptosporangium arvum]|uniref:Putative lipid carrier protein n=1 Tax=Cryptosporangium arvum DSM 44712 TaxID=927661 RepID=A0A010YMD5_9ACTN|nr:SCP2 sterol-binding domain-containing protein [Cryptosporangium arvum]EXG81385.1 putative lipid carrier protein [Cryptosporangium arvum DSM 44712]